MPSYRQTKPVGKNGAKPKMPMHKMPDGHMMKDSEMKPAEMKPAAHGKKKK